MILTEKVRTRAVGKWREYYANLGYEVLGGFCEVSVSDLPKSSAKKVTAQCSVCKGERQVKFHEYTDTCLPCTRKSFVGKNNPAWKGGKPSCKYCGCEVSNYNNESCHSCQSTIGQSGENNHAYKGGKPSCSDCGKELSDHRGKKCRDCFIASTKKEETNKRQRNKAHKTLVKNVLIRDDYTCKLCSKRNNGKLEVHHLEGWSENKRLRFDESNCVCLCKQCHTDFHKKYGYGRNTAEQFNEYMGTI